MEGNLGVRFELNPAGAPHWGGTWERLIQEVKKIIAASCESVADLSPDAFRTLLTQIEAILNRRPLSFDEAGRPISPAQLLGPNIPQQFAFRSSVRVARKVLQASQFFWQRFTQWFLLEHSVDRIHRGKVKADDLQAGDRVLLNEGKGLIDSWVPGVIEKVHISNDGFIRSVVVGTEKGSFWRSIRQIATAEDYISRAPRSPESPATGECRRQ